MTASGDPNGAASLVRAAWREDELSSDSEKDLLASFPGVLTRADHKARADRLFGQEKIDAGLRAAKLAGGDLAALGEARAAIFKRAGNAAKLLAAVPASARSDQGYLLALAQLARRKDDAVAAARAFAEAPRDPKLIVAPDQWWLERRHRGAEASGLPATRAAPIASRPRRRRPRAKTTKPTNSSRPAGSH